MSRATAEAMAASIGITIDNGSSATFQTGSLGNEGKLYDSAGRMRAAATTDGEMVSYVYNANGSRMLTYYEDGTREEYTYDKAGNVLSVLHKDGNGNFLNAYIYRYDEDNNLIFENKTAGTTIYTYDSMDRISTITEEATGKTTEYTYDGAGNRLTKSITEQGKTITTEYIYDSFDHLMKEKSDDGTTILYNYDKDGNQISRLTENGKGSTGTANGSVSGASLVIVSVSGTNGTGSSELTLYRYDSFNRLISVKQGDTTSTYTYDPADYRTSSTVNGVTTYSSYENGKLKAEADGTKTVTAVNHYGLVLYARETLTESYYYLYNAHRDVVMLVYTQGGIAATYQYDAFGNILKTTGNADNTTTYAGYQYDESTGLYYVNARYYDSTTARFLTEDSYTGQRNDPLSLNRYTYCENNPLKYYDPSGHKVKATQIDDLASGFASSALDTTVDNMCLIGMFGIYGIYRNVKNGVETVQSFVTDLSMYDDSIVQYVWDSLKNALGGATNDLENAWKNRNILLDNKTYSNQKVYEYGITLGGAYSEAVTYGFIVCELTKEIVRLLAQGMSMEAAMASAKTSMGLEDEFAQYADDASEALSTMGDDAAGAAGTGAEAVEGTAEAVNITNDVLKAPRAGSALKLDDYHAFNDIVDNYAELATKTPINNGTLYQHEGSLNGVQGRFEWIIDSTGQYAGQVSHRYFVSGGTLNGVPIKP